ncbi:MAG: rhamnan synthesis F family protein [Burkholderiaceae bacterium]
MTFTDSLRAWRRDLKARMPYVRRREHRILQRRYTELIDGLGWTALPATQAKLLSLKPIAADLQGDVCFFVSHAPQAALKKHVQVHIEHLLRSDVRVVLVLNTALAPEQVLIEPGLQGRLSGACVRENIGFDFAAWAHLYSLCVEQVPNWTRLFLVNDSIVGPLNQADFDRVMQRIRHSSADVVGLTESQSPLRHVQSFFLAFNRPALRHPAVQQMFQRMLSLPSKGQVIDVYETRMTRWLTDQGLLCEALFPPLSDDRHSANDTSFRWAQLIRAGFPYIKTSILERFAGSPQVKALVPPGLISTDN